MDNNVSGRDKNLDQAVESAREALSATVEAADEKMTEARNRLAAALESARAAYNHAEEKAVETAKATDKLIRANPYTSLGVALGVGALIGFFLGRRGRS
jgi:ElaB/YqjD/DUF883 family membrane-anchored ribosome-binding protein